jgi:FAD:protein FMN transferase
VRPPFRHVAHFEQVLGTTLELQIVAGQPAQAEAAQHALLAEIARLELIFSRFLPQSELNRWLASSGEAVPVSPELGSVLQQALAWISFSGGAFHPASEALSALWKQAEASGERPDVQPLLDQMKQPPYTVAHETINPAGDHRGERWTATKLTPLPLGFNAFAKGFIADRAAELASAAAGVRQVVVNIGGDLRCLGPGQVRVDIADPGTLADNAAPVSVVQVCQQGVATSGRARRGFTVNGQWHSHLLDPRTGQPADDVVCASVVAPDSASADVLATIFSILEPQESLRLADLLPDMACLLIDKRGQLFRNARWTELETSPAPKLLWPPNFSGTDLPSSVQQPPHLPTPYRGNP